jgi:hypothetical protein
LSKWEGDESNTRYEGNSFLNDDDDKDHIKERNTEPQAWHVKMTCKKCLRKGHIAAFCDDTDKADTNVQDGETQEEAAAQLLDGSKIAGENEGYYADLFLCEDNQEHRSVSFQLKDGINGGWIPKDWVLLFDSQSTTDAFSNPDLLKEIIKIGVATNHITVLARNRSKIVRAPTNLFLIS